jgi:hypothetical protein
VSTDADVDALLAEIFYRLENHISPPVRFYTLQELLAKGKPIEEIFEGPALDHGFIDDDEFRAIRRRCEIRASDIVDLLMEKDLAQVIAVRNMSLLSFVDHKLRLQESWILPLATDRFRAPIFSPGKSKIVFFKNGLPYFANRDRALELLKTKHAAEGRLKLNADKADLQIPVGQDGALGEYFPIQNELPAVYGVGDVGVPASEPPLRKAQSKQLKAYLLFFEQLLANYLAQLEHVPELFSWETVEGPTYFTQKITGKDIKNIEEIYNGDADLVKKFKQEPGPSKDDPFKEALQEIIETEKIQKDRRGRFLDHLIGRFCEDFTEYSLLMYSMYRDDDQIQPRILKEKRAFLEEYPAASRERGTAFDYRSPGISGYQRRVYRLLGIDDVRLRNLALDRLRLQESTEGKWQFVLTDEQRRPLFKSIAGTRHTIEAFLDFTLNIAEKILVRQNRNTGTEELYYPCPQKGMKREVVIGQTTAEKDAKDKTLEYLKQYAESEGFHLVEHILLRPRTKADPFMPVQLDESGERCCPDVEDPYSFRATIVLPAWPKRFRDMRFRKFVEDTLRREAPAYIFLKICWISHHQMNEFEGCYGEWSAQLAKLEPRLGLCPRKGDKLKSSPMSGGLPLPDGKDDVSYTAALTKLIAILHELVTIYPAASLHDCTDTSGDEPQVTLNNTNLGTF